MKTPSSPQVKRIPVKSIIPAPYNPRVEFKPGDPEFDRLQASLGGFGCVEVLVFNKRTRHLVSGHRRLAWLKANGATHVMVSVVNMSLDKEKALNIALNRVRGEFDESKLAALLDELSKQPEFDVAVTGFDVAEVQDLIGRVLTPEAGAAELDKFDAGAELARAGKGPAVTKPGEIIELGRDPRLRHRLMCGDCSSAEAVRRLMGTQRGAAVLMATDPPYLVDYDGTNHPGAKPEHKLKPGQKNTKNKDWSATYGVTWDDASGNPELYEKFIATAIGDSVSAAAAFYIWHASRRQAMLEAAMNKSDIFVHCQVIWAKNRPVLTRTWYAWQHEPCLMGWRRPPKGKKPRRVEPSVHSTVWSFDTIPNGPERPDHPTPKPLALFEIPIRQHTRPGEIVYEPFAGSGTQILAAQRLGRRCYACEISPVYCDLIVRRFIAAFGEAAVDPKLAKRYRLPAGKVRVAA